MKITIENNDYELVKNYRDGFNEDEVNSKYTDYFERYDYIFGDWAYGKLRLKGFYESSNKNASLINDISIIDKYINEHCAYGCRYFLLKKDCKKKQ